MRTKLLIIAMLCCMCLFGGCSGCRDNCKKMAIAEYGEQNIIALSGYWYLVKQDNKILLIYKGNLINADTTKTRDITNFVKGNSK